ncbi:MAG TPA: hypothetical protein VFW05_13040 [Verrucomicrobiae bacterium]|nr:hypothetical protein [Verrucomicrobiae bacterium]
MIFQSVNPLLDQWRAHGVDRQNERSRELPQANSKVVDMNRRTARTAAVGNEFFNHVRNRFAFHVCRMLLFVKLNGFGKCDVLWQIGASRRVIPDDFNQTGDIRISNALSLCQKREGLFQRNAFGRGQSSHTECALCFLFGDPGGFCAGFFEVSEAAHLPIPVGVIAQKETGKILSPDVSFVLIDFYRDITAADHMRPCFWKTDGLGLRGSRTGGNVRFHALQCDNTVTTKQAFRRKLLIYMVPTEGVEPTHS